MKKEHQDDIKLYRQKQNKNNTSRNIRFNPPYSKSMKTNIRGIFLKLTRNHFAVSEIMCKLFKKNNVKVSYCYAKNMKKY